MATFKIGRLVMKSLFKKPATLMYPVIAREWQERTRGAVAINPEDCIGCGMCQRKCPTNAITVDRNAGTWEIQRMQCIQCAHCTEDCPKKCLSMDPKYTAPGTEKVIDTFEIPTKKPAAAGDDAKADGGGKVKCNTEECVYCGLCAKTCPADAITVDRGEKKWEVSDDCIGCGACVEKCPKKCLEL
ncbi:MAG: 4Fe-4S dicluster domain-containing protein [Bacillota bacterium]|nr:4Fe-4S dicluster domain-containing protein [Bacillota bacterium]